MSIRKSDVSKSMTLRVPSKFINPSAKFIWGSYIIEQIIQSNIFKVKHLPPREIAGSKREYSNLLEFYIDDVHYLLDDWDYDHPTSLLNDSFFQNNPFLRDVTCILKLQFHQNTLSNNFKIIKQYSLNILPFTFFSNHSVKLSSFLWENKSFKYLTHFTGKPWKFRKPFLNYLTNQSDCFVQAGTFPLEYNEWVNIVKDSRWGLILHGKGEGKKNRREVEYMSWGVPLALTYKPIYYFPFKENIDYIYIESPSDIDKLRDIDPIPFHERSLYNYKTFFSPIGMSNLLKKIHLENKR